MTKRRRAAEQKVGIRLTNTSQVTQEARRVAGGGGGGTGARWPLKGMFFSLCDKQERLRCPESHGAPSIINVSDELGLFPRAGVSFPSVRVPSQVT